MNITQVKKALPVLLKHGIAPFLWGNQGVGKTSAIEQYCRDNNLGLVHLYTATQEVGDLVGLLVKNDKDGTAYHTRPEWFPLEGSGIIFLDELNRAPNDVIQSLFSFILSGRLHRHQLPPGWKVVAAGNYNSDRFTVTDTSDAAFLSRFCHIDFTPSVDEWLVYAETKGADDVAAFIREQPSMLELSAKAGGRLDDSFIVPDRRAWLGGVFPIDAEPELSEELKYELICGLVGVASAAAYSSWKNKKEKALTLADVMEKYKGKTRARVKEISATVKEVRFDLLNQPIDELMVRLEGTPDYLTGNDYLDNLRMFLQDIPKELAMKAFSRLHELKEFYGRNELLNDPDYVLKFK